LNVSFSSPPPLSLTFLPEILPLTFALAPIQTPDEIVYFQIGDGPESDHIMLEADGPDYRLYYNAQGDGISITYNQWHALTLLPPNLPEINIAHYLSRVPPFFQSRIDSI